MALKSQHWAIGCDGVIATLEGAVCILDLAKEACPIAPAQAAFGCVSTLLTVIKVWFPLSCSDAKLPVHTRAQGSMANKDEQQLATGHPLAW